MNSESFDIIRKSIRDFLDTLNELEPSYGGFNRIDSAIVWYTHDAFKDMQDEVTMELGDEPDDLPASVVECKIPAAEAFDEKMGNPIAALDDLIHRGSAEAPPIPRDWIKTTVALWANVPAGTVAQVKRVDDDGYFVVSFDGVHNDFLHSGRWTDGEIVKVPAP